MTEDVQYTGNDIVVDDKGRPVTVTGANRLEQSIGIHVRDVMLDRVGGVLTDETLADITSSLNTAVDRDDDIDAVESVNVQEIDRLNDAVTVTANLSARDDIETTVEL